MTVAGYEVVWPLSKRHYLSIPDDPVVNESAVMNTAIASADLTPAAPSRPSTSGRDLAARALLAGAGCAPPRVSELLGVSRRTLGRMVAADLTAALHEAPLVEQARTWLVDSARRGRCTAEERDAAIAWLRDAPHDAPPVARVRPQAASRRPAAATSPPRRGRTRHGRLPRSRPSNGGPPLSALARAQVDALTRQQQRILHRSALLTYVLAAEQQNGQPLTLGDALAELLADITEAARTIGTLLQPAPDGRPHPRR